MTSLRDIQLAFKNSLLSKDDHDAESHVDGTNIPAEQRLQIYRNNARIGFHNAMAATYPVVEKLGGSDWFKQSVRDYQLHYPSMHGDLQYVGERYAAFLEESLRDTDYGYFADVAKLEWAYQEVLIAPASTSLDPAKLADVSANNYETLQFHPRTELRLVTSSFPVLEIWKAHQPGADTMSYHINFDRPPSNILLIRRNDHVELREVAQAEFVLLQCFADNMALGQVAEVTSTIDGMDLGGSLRSLISLQAIRAFDTTENSR